jgi:hypothetical protein
MSVTNKSELLAKLLPQDWQAIFRAKLNVAEAIVASLKAPPALALELVLESPADHGFDEFGNVVK